MTTQPTGKACTVGLAGQQTVADDNVDDVAVTCVINTYSISGTVSGLANGETITLTLSPTGATAETKSVIGDTEGSTDDAFTFDTKLVAGASYTITTTSTVQKTCRVVPAGEQIMGDADVTDIVVTCELTYFISGRVSGAADNSQITITLLLADSNTSRPINVTTVSITPNANGEYSFTDIPRNKYYFIVVASATANEVCTSPIATFSDQLIINFPNRNINCSIATANTYSVGGTISGLADDETIFLTLSPTGGNVESIIITADADATTADNFAFNTKLVNGDTYTTTVAIQPTGRTCTVDNAGTRTMGEADVTDVTVTCITNYSISGSVTGTASNVNTFVILTLYDDNAGAGATGQSVRANVDGTYSFTGIPENKFYTLQASSLTAGETCSGAPTTPTQITADITGTRITCTASTHTGPFIKLQVLSGSYESSLAAVNVFIADNAVPDTSGTPSHVVNGSGADVVIVPLIYGIAGDGFIYNIPIDAGQYYAVTATTTSTSGTCPVTLNGSGGPVNNNLTVEIECD